MGAGLVLEARPGVVALHHEGDVAEAAHVGRLARQGLDLPPVQVGVALVHVEEVGGPEVALLAALAAADLDDHVLAVVGVAGHEQLAQPRVELGELGLLGPDLVGQVVAHLVVVLRIEQLPGLRDLGLDRPVLPSGVDDRLQLGVSPAGVARRVAVTRRGDVGQLGFELLQLGLQIGEPIEHALQATCGFLRSPPAIRA